ncbi:MAG: 3-oxoadipate enol-lactonase [Hyphomicrobiales bacterium]|jgi:3-oxoadipate enol-lactonase|nr:3-oxoadipate enol-lactonase [Hyphomicrobiales bacterium]
MTVELNHRIDGSGPRVLLLHAVGMDLTLLDALTAILQKDFAVLRADLRGHGCSPYVPATSLADYADDVHALLARLSFAPCGVAGFAMGGMVAQALTVNYPQDVRAAVFANINHQQTKQSYAALMSRASDAKGDGMAKIVDATMQRWFTEPFIAKGGDAAVRARLAGDDVRAWCDAFTAMANVDTAQKLKDIKVPALCLAGEVDKSTPPAAVKAMADAIPGARYVILPGAPHMSFIEMPQDVAKVVGGFFREVL